VVVISLSSLLPRLSSYLSLSSFTDSSLIYMTIITRYSSIASSIVNRHLFFVYRPEVEKRGSAGRRERAKERKKERGRKRGKGETYS